MGQFIRTTKAYLGHKVVRLLLTFVAVALEIALFVTISRYNNRVNRYISENSVDITSTNTDIQSASQITDDSYYVLGYGPPAVGAWATFVSLIVNGYAVVSLHRSEGIHSTFLHVIAELVTFASWIAGCAYSIWGAWWYSQVLNVSLYVRGLKAIVGIASTFAAVAGLQVILVLIGAVMFIRCRSATRANKTSV